MRKLINALALASGLVFATSAAVAQDYPSKPIRVIVPLAAGGGSDVFARLMQPHLEKELGQPIVVVNVPGAGTVIGSRQVKDAKPDGYTVLLNHVALHSTYALKKADFSYKDFAVVAGTTEVPNMVIAPAAKGYKSLKDVLDKAKADPGKLVAGVNLGAPNHLSIALVAARGGDAKFRYVQTGGASETLTALLGERADVGILTTADAASFRDSGEVAILGILADERHADYPNVPTAKEQGVDVKMTLDYYWLMPKGTPEANVKVFADALEAVMKKPEVRTALEKQFISPTFSRGEAADASLAAGLKSIEEAVQAAGLDK
jgi:tripartite-type tricarboxylate transporter receptor subunit TctC